MQRNSKKVEKPQKISEKPVKILTFWLVSQKVFTLEGWNKLVHVASMSIKNISKNDNGGKKLRLLFFTKFGHAENTFFSSIWRFSKSNISRFLSFYEENNTFSESPWKELSNGVQFVGIVKSCEFLIGAWKISKIANFRTIEKYEKIRKFTLYN